MAFVQVEHSGRNPESFQRSQSAHAEQQFLTNANTEISAVQARRQLAVFGSVAFHIGIQQQQVPASHFHAPDFRPNAATAGFDLDDHWPAIFSDRHFHRHLIDVGLQIFLSLPSSNIEPLPKIALAIKQTNSDKRDVEIGRALDVIACQHA